MKQLKKFTLNEAENISNDEMKLISAGDTRDVTIPDCKVEGDKVPNEGQICIASYDKENNVLVLGKCRAIYGIEGGNGQYTNKVTAYCDTGK